jgi:predicted component of type VI protein secretion system
MKRINYLMLIILTLIFLLTGCQGSEEKSENETITIDLGEETNETTSDTLPVFFAKSL